VPQGRHVHLLLAGGLLESCQRVESPGGISPPGAPRTVHDPLESHGSRCSAVAMTAGAGCPRFDRCHGAATRGRGWSRLGRRRSVVACHV
jgi:hypothetical protein